MFIRPIGALVRSRLGEDRRFIQVLAGPRQTGKTTLARQVTDALDVPVHFASADGASPRDRVWIEQQWAVGRIVARQAGARGAVIVLDEIQKIADWSESVKQMWDEDAFTGVNLRVLLLGSAPLLVHRGLSESLTGRFEVIPVTHWSLAEMRAAFGWDVDRYVYFGAYPGAAPLVADEQRWADYIQDALIETTLGRDILLLSRVDKPALLRGLFVLGGRYSGQILSYQKMLGQLHDAGNTTTLAHYLDLLSGAGLVTGIAKYSGQVVRQRGSSPKLQVLNTGLANALGRRRFADAKADPDVWGRLVESAIGAHLVNQSRVHGFDLFYWRDRNREVDFVVQRGQHLVGIEVKSGRRPEALPGMQAFAAANRPSRVMLIGTGGMPVADFLLAPVSDWLPD
jgi:uncharacterized protein